MELRTYRNSVLLVRRILDIDRPTEPVIAARPGKPAFAPEPGAAPAAVPPESRGVPAGLLAQFYGALEADRTLDMHGVSIWRGGELLADGAFGPWRRDIWQISYSECKSLTGLAIGFLVAEGRLTLDEKPLEILGFGGGFGLKKHALAALTVRDLLTMRSGSTLNEAASVTETEWLRCFFDSSVKAAPGTAFSYNSMNTYVLSAIVQKKSGLPLDDYLRPRLFEPLGIRQLYWERSPEGIVKGGWGLYLLPADMAKLGRLLLDGGVYNGRRLLPAEWVQASTRIQASAPAAYGAYDYGYQLWVHRRNGSFLFNGLFGQNLLCYPQNGLVLASNAGNDEFFQQSSYYRIADEFFARDFAAELPADRAADRRLAAVLRNLGRRTALMDPLPGPGPCPPWKALAARAAQKKLEAERRRRARALDGRAFTVPAGHGGGVGLAPLYLQSLQNCHTGGLREVSFAWQDGGLWLRWAEAGRVHRFEVGLGRATETVLDLGPEQHRAAVTGAFAQNEDGVPVLKVRIAFLESCHTRLLKFFFEPGGLRLALAEQPGLAYLREGLGVTLGEQPSRVLRAVARTGDNEFARLLLARAFEPVLLLGEKPAPKPAQPQAAADAENAKNS